MINYDFDIIVVGASPAGLMATLNSNDENSDLKIALFDKKKSPKDSIHPSNSFYSGMFCLTNEIISKNYVLHELEGMKLISPSKKEIILQNKGWAIDKFKFDFYYLNKVSNSGVSIYFNYEIVDVKINKEFVFVKVVNDNKIYHFISKIIIISDGVESKVSKLLKMNTMYYPNDIAWGLEAVIESKNIGTPDYAEYFFGSHAPGWKSSYLPMGKNNASIGVYVRGHGKNINSYFSKWISSFQKLKGLATDDITISSIKFGGDPIVTIPNQIYGDRVIISGGAAGQSGIAYAMLAGKIAGSISKESVLSNSFTKKHLSNYYKTWKQCLYLEHILGRFSLEVLRKLNDNQINYIFELFENQDMSQILNKDRKLTCISTLSHILKKDPFFILKLIYKK